MRSVIFLLMILIASTAAFGGMGTGNTTAPGSDTGDTSIEKSAQDPFIELNSRLIDGGDLGINTSDWYSVEGDTFTFSLPPHFSVKFFQDVAEVADIYFYGFVVSKIIVGYLYESEPVTDTLNKVVREYLWEFGDFSITDSCLGLDTGESTTDIFSLEFSGMPCWAVFNSESKNAGDFGPGKYFIFLGLPDEAEIEVWAGWYAGMVRTLNLF